MSTANERLWPDSKPCRWEEGKEVGCGNRPDDDFAEDGDGDAAVAARSGGENEDDAEEELKSAAGEDEEDRSDTRMNGFANWDVESAWAAAAAADCCCGSRQDEAKDTFLCFGRCDNHGPIKAAKRIVCIHCRNQPKKNESPVIRSYLVIGFTIRSR